MSNNQLMAPSAFSSENGKAVYTTVNLFLVVWSPLYLISDSQQTTPQHTILINATPHNTTLQDISTSTCGNMPCHAVNFHYILIENVTLLFIRFSMVSQHHLTQMVCYSILLQGVARCLIRILISLAQSLLL